MYKNILHATDLNENHFHISEKAKAVAEHFKAKMYLIHVIELPTSIQLAQSLGFAELAHPSKKDANTVIQLLGEAIQVPSDQLFVEIGTASDQVLKKSTELGCDLIIIGSHSSEGFSSFLGSTASAIVHKAPCDVLTLRNN